jgi:hypothetical protein
VEKKTSASAAGAVQTDRRNEKKWGKEVMEAGWLAVPSVLLQLALELLSEREARKQQKHDRQRRKRPTLTVLRSKKV